MLRSLRMTGSSIAAPSAAAWVTDFLKAAAFARGSTERDPDDLRLAFSVLTTRWHRLGRRLTATDVAAFHGAFGGQRLRRLARLRSPTLTRDALLDGAERLLGPGFAEAYGDPARTGWGIVFLDPAERAAYAPESRLAHAALGALAPPRSAPSQQRWHTYPAVPVASAPAALEALAEVERWPEFGSELGRFTPLRSGGLLGQTFEIEVVASPLLRAPVYTRGYVTATRVLDDRAELDAYAARLAHEAPDLAPLPDGASVAGVVELVTHAGHFIGRGISRLVVFEHEGSAFVRDVGSWDPMPLHLALAYGLAGRRAQAAFWGDEHEAKSMLRQLARRL